MEQDAPSMDSVLRAGRLTSFHRSYSARPIDAVVEAILRGRHGKLVGSGPENHRCDGPPCPRSLAHECWRVLTSDSEMGRRDRTETCRHRVLPRFSVAARRRGLPAGEMSMALADLISWRLTVARDAQASRD